MNCQIQFPRKNKKIILKCRLLNFLPSMQSDNESIKYKCLSHGNEPKDART